MKMKMDYQVLKMIMQGEVYSWWDFQIEHFIWEEEACHIEIRKM